MPTITDTSPKSKTSSDKRTQAQRILNLLLEGFRQRREIPLPEILNLRISQFGTRIKELRAAGWQIVNRQEAIEGRRLSWYSLKSAIQTKVIAQPEPRQGKPAAPVGASFDFGRKEPQPAKPETKEGFRQHLGAIAL